MQAGRQAVKRGARQQVKARARAREREGEREGRERKPKWNRRRLLLHNAAFSMQTPAPTPACAPFLLQTPAPTPAFVPFLMQTPAPTPACAPGTNVVKVFKEAIESGHKYLVRSLRWVRSH